MLYCLRAWSEHALELYGVDPDEIRLSACYELFPELKAHFAPLSLAQLDVLPEASLPATYDYVYWNVWDDFEFDAPQFAGYLERAFAAVKAGGRLILGFYDADKAHSEAQLEWLSENVSPPRASWDNALRPELFACGDKGLSR